MKPVTEALEELLSLGVQGPALIAAIRRVETAAYENRLAELEAALARAVAQADARSHDARTKERERKRAWRENKTRSSPGHFGTSQDEAGHAGTSRDETGPPPPPSPKERSPEPPKEITPPPAPSAAPYRANVGEAAPLEGEVLGRLAVQAQPLEEVSDWPAVGEGQRSIAIWAAKLTAVAGPGLADPAKTPGLLTSSVEISKWKRAGCSWENDVVPVIVARTMNGRRDPITTWSFFTTAILNQAATRRASLSIPEGNPHGNVQPPRGGADSRATRGSEKLADIHAAMCGAI